MGFEVDMDGSTDLNAPAGNYLWEITKGSDTKENEHGVEVPRTTAKTGCPYTMFTARLVMDESGDKTFENTFINIIIQHDDKGSRQIRNMANALLGQQSGKMTIMPDTFNGKKAWAKYAHRNGWDNMDHQTWQHLSSVKLSAAVQAAAATTTVAPGATQPATEQVAAATDDDPFAF